MGTRHIILVKLDNEYKIAQYGQWDGYPSGQGVEILKFLNESNNIEKLKTNLSKVRFIDNERDKIFLKSFLNEQELRTEEQKAWFNKYITRDLGAVILDSVANSTDTEIILKNSINFINDVIFCEYGYVIDFDLGTFEVYKGFNETPLEPGDRFFEFETENGYNPIKLIVSYKLNNLPTVEEFLNLNNEI